MFHQDAAVIYHKEHGEFPYNGKGMEQENLKDFSKHTRLLLPKNKTYVFNCLCDILKNPRLISAILRNEEGVLMKKTLKSLWMKSINSKQF